MQKQQETIKAITQDELKSLAAETGPCVTIYSPTQPAENTARQDQTHLREATRQATERLRESGLDKGSIEELLSPIRQLTAEEWDVAHGSVVILRSADGFRHFQIPVELKDSVY